MFDYEDSEINFALEILYMDKLVHESCAATSNVPLCYDCYHEAFTHALDHCTEHVCYELYPDEYNPEYEKCTFTDTALTKYFALANEYGKLTHVRYKNNPYIKSMISDLRKIIHIPSYQFDWDIKYSARNGYEPCFEFYYGMEFFEYSYAVKSILGVLDYFKRGIKKIEKEIYKMKNYSVNIVETLSRIVEIEAASKEEAEEIVEKDYRDGKIILDADDYLEVEFTAV